jgi:hypothetical protein
MNAAGVVLLAHLIATGPRECSPGDGSSGRALSDAPYAQPKACLEEPNAPERSGASLPSNAAQEGAMSQDRRVAFGILGTGAAFLVMGASMFYCSRADTIGAQRTFCRDAWPWLAGTGLGLAGVGLGLAAYTSSENDRLGSARAGRRDWGVGPTFALSLP